MKIKKSTLRNIVKEELENILKLVSDFSDLDKFKKEKTYHDEENDCDDDFITGVKNSTFGFGDGGKRKHPTDYLKGGANEESVSDHIMIGSSEDNKEEGLPDLVIRWQQLAESKRR